MANSDLFVTFTVFYQFRQHEKYAVRCMDLEQAQGVGYDANSLAGVRNIRIRRCSKPYGRTILDYDTYWDLKKWY